MMYNCTILDDYQDVSQSYADWSTLDNALNLHVINQYISSEDELVKKLKNSEIIVIMRERTPFTKSLLEKLPALKLLVTSGPRNSAIDLETATGLGVKVCGTSAFKQPPTELTWALILGLARQLPLENKNFRESGPWQSTVGLTLSGKILGLLGLGKIGERVAKIAQAFGMNVLAWSENLSVERAQDIGVTLANSKTELLEKSDIVSLHLIPGKRNVGIIGAPEFALMKSSSLLINTSRSKLVDQEAMYQALVTKQIRAAGVDVFDIEPLPLDHKFRALDNLLATPHLGYVADVNYQAYFSGAMANIQAFVDNSELSHRLN